MPLRSHRAPLLLALLLALAAAGCAHGPRAPEGASPAFVGVGRVDVFAATDIPHAVAQPLGITPTELARGLRERLERGGVRMAREGDGPMENDMVNLSLKALEVEPGVRAVWVQLYMSRVLRFPGREVPLAAIIWEESAKVVVRGGDTAALRTAIERLADEYAREYRAASPEMTSAATR